MTQIPLDDPQIDDPRTLYYRNSGKTPIVRLLLALLTITPAVAIAATIYALLTSHLPALSFAKLVIIAAGCLMAGFAFGVGALTGRMLMWARVRNLAMVWAVALWAAFFAWYVSWVVWEWHTLGRMGFEAPLARLLTHPRGVWFVARGINQFGTFGMGSSDDAIKGPMLWFLWFVEAAVVLGVATIVPYRMVRGLAFCETCQKWGRRREGILSVGPAEDEERLRARLALKDLSALEELGPANMSAPRRLRVDLQNCESCAQMHLLSVYRIEVSYPKGQRTEKARLLVDRLWLDPEQAEAVQQIKEGLYARPPGQTASLIDPPQGEAAEEPADNGSPPTDDTRPPEGGVGL
jgi:hypothetical protein